MGIFQDLVDHVASRVGQGLNSLDANLIGSHINVMNRKTQRVAERGIAKRVAGNTDNVVLKHMTNDDGYFGGGNAGIARMATGVANYKGTNAALRDEIATWSKKGAGSPLDAEYIKKHIAALKGQLNSPGRVGTAAWDMAAGAGQYLWGGSWGQRAAKVGTAAGAYMVGSGALRAVTTGGGMFKDSQGNTDIAGIPFI